MNTPSNPYISSNPYRIIGVLSNSGVKEIHKNLSKLKAFAQLGKKIEFDYDLNFLNLAEAERYSEIISKVESRVLLDDNKVKYSLFWFLDSSPYDAIALSNLINGNTEKAIEIWEKATKSNEVTVKNYASFNNLATLLILMSFDESKYDIFNKSDESISHLKRALNYKCNLITSEFFSNFCNDIGVTNDISIPEIQTFFATTIIEIINKNFSSKELVDLVGGLDESFASIINTNLVKNPISNIKNNIQEASKELAANEKNGIAIGKQLIKNSNRDLIYLRDTLGATDYEFEALADNLANQVLQCGILYFNATGNDQDYLSSYNYALNIAIGEKTKNRAKETIKHCVEVKDASICKFCNINEIYKASGIRIEMHRMTSFNQYTYFKNGGIEIYCCKTCYNKKSNSKFFAPIVAFIGYAAASVLSYGILIGIDIVFAQFSIGKWWFGFVKKNLFFNSVSKHPIISSALQEGYEFGMPS